MVAAVPLASCSLHTHAAAQQLAAAAAMQQLHHQQQQSHPAQQNVAPSAGLLSTKVVDIGESSSAMTAQHTTQHGGAGAWSGAADALNENDVPMSPCGEYSDGNAQSVGSLPSMCSVLSKEGSVRGLGGSHPESDFENLLDVNELSLSDNLQEQLAEALQRRPPTNPQHNHSYTRHPLAASTVAEMVQ